MNREEIIELAREAGVEFKDRAEPKLERFAELVIEHDRETWMGGPAMRQFADLVAAAEREACAKLCEEIARKNEAECDIDWVTGNMECADYIRARGESK
jgi:hypothetical protein